MENTICLARADFAYNGGIFMSEEKARRYNYKVHVQGDYRLVGICDMGIVGKEFQEEKKKIFVDPAFYCSDVVEESQISNLISTADSVNLVGNDVVEHVIEMGLVDPNCVIVIQGVKHAQIISF